MARIANKEPLYKILFDSGTTSHMISDRYKIIEGRSSSLEIKLADDSTISSNIAGTRKVSWMTSEGKREVNLSNKPVVADISISLLSIPALLEKILQ